MTNSNIAPVLADLAERINAEHDKAESTFKTAFDHAMKAGELLTEAKAAVPHGEWLPWLCKHCRFSERTAQAYMRLAREMPKLDPAKAKRVADLSTREAIKALAEPKSVTPDSPPDKPFDVDSPDIWIDPELLPKRSCAGSTSTRPRW